MTRWIDEDGRIHDTADCGCGVCTNFEAYEPWFRREGWIVPELPLIIYNFEEDCDCSSMSLPGVICQVFVCEKHDHDEDALR